MISGDEKPVDLSMAANLNLPAIPQFDAHSEPSSIGTRWKEWREQFDYFATAANVKVIKDKRQKRALLLHLLGPTIQKYSKVSLTRGMTLIRQQPNSMPISPRIRIFVTNATASNKLASNRENPSTNLHQDCELWLKNAISQKWKMR